LEAQSVRCEVHYSGRVQGVGFRFTAQEAARNYAVSGFVQNLNDGRVQLVAEGSPGEVERFLADLAERMQGKIRQAAESTSPATGQFTGFEIRP
jgi:acylphosphatase